jgi:hypothetical protein
MRVLIARSRTPLQSPSGAGFEQILRAELKGRGVEVDLIELPKGVGIDPVFQEFSIWRSLDLGSVGGIPVDLVVAVSPLAMFLRHPKKIAWLKEFDALPKQLLSVLDGIAAYHSSSDEIASAIERDWAIRSEVLEPPAPGDQRWDEVIKRLLALAHHD